MPGRIIIKETFSLMEICSPYSGKMFPLSSPEQWKSACHPQSGDDAWTAAARCLAQLGNKNTTTKVAR
jgi:hypothetical protein